MKEQPEQSHGTNFLSYTCQETHCSTGDIFDDEGDDEHDDGDGNDDIEDNKDNDDFDVNKIWKRDFWLKYD